MSFSTSNNPKFSWSYSRERMLQTCELCYGLWYYGSNNGWLPESNDLAKAAYRVKTAEPVKQYLERRINTYAKDMINGKVPYDAEEMKKHLRGKLNERFVKSRDKVEWLNRPKKSKMLRELTDSDEFNPEVVREMKKNIETFSENLLKSKTIQEVLVQHRYDDIQSLSPFAKYQLEELPNIDIYVQMTAILVNNNSHKIVIPIFHNDARKVELLQTGSILLGLKNLTELNLPEYEVIIRTENLATGKSIDKVVDQSLEGLMIESIHDSIAGMAEFVKDRDLAKNEMLGIKAFKRNIAHAHPDGTECPYCASVQHEVAQEHRVG